MHVIPLRPGRTITVPLLLLCLVLAPLPTLHADELTETQAQLDQLKRKIAQLDGWLNHANREKSGLVDQLRKEEKAIDRVSRDIRSNQQDIAALLRQLTELEQEHKSQMEALAQQKDDYAAQIRASYLQDQQPALKLLLNADSPVEALRQMRYLGYLNQARSDKISHFQALLERLEQTEADLLTRKTELGRTREALASNQKRLNQSLAQRKQVLARLDAEIRQESTRLAGLKADQGRLEQLLQELEQALANLDLAGQDILFGEQRAQLPWPTHGKVLAGFGAQLIPGKLSSQGIRIASTENAPVTAIHHGRIVFSDWLRGFGLLIIVDHGEGFMSLYGNNRSLVKETGDWVQAEEVIAYASASTTNPDSGLYFEIRQHGKPQNPLFWLKKR
jgi:septal ring factor EnvC (AmiA/AmiB activator)